MVGIYKITNMTNGKSYIGQSTDISRRWSAEKADSNNPNSHSYNYPLMKAFRKYGINNFNFEVVEECGVEELNQREMYWIDFYDAFFNGYNQTLGGDTTLRQPKENVVGVISDLINTNLTHKDIASKWNTSIEMVQGINTGRYWKHEAEYPLQKSRLKFQNKDNEETRCYCEKCQKEITKGSKLCFECHNILQASKSNRPVKEILIRDLYDNKGNFTKVGQKYGVNGNSVKKWCKKYGISYKSSDYKTAKPPKEK